MLGKKRKFKNKHAWLQLRVELFSSVYNDHRFPAVGKLRQESEPAWLKVIQPAELSPRRKAFNAATRAANDAVTSTINQADLTRPNVRLLTSALVPRYSLSTH